MKEKDESMNAEAFCHRPPCECERSYSDDQTERKCRFLRGKLIIIIIIINNNNNGRQLQGDAMTIILPEISDWRSLQTDPPSVQGEPVIVYKSRLWAPFSEALQSPPPTRPPLTHTHPCLLVICSYSLEHYGSGCNQYPVRYLRRPPRAEP